MRTMSQQEQHNANNANRRGGSGCSSADDSSGDDPAMQNDGAPTETNADPLLALPSQDVSWTRRILMHLMTKNFCAEIAAADTVTDRISRCDDVFNDLVNLRQNLPGIVTAFDAHEQTHLLTQLLPLMRMNQIFQRSVIIQQIAEAIVRSTADVNNNFIGLFRAARQSTSFKDSAASSLLPPRHGGGTAAAGVRDNSASISRISRAPTIEDARRPAVQPR